MSEALPPRLVRSYLEIDVLTAARERISKLFDDFESICVAYSGGKDSSVTLHLAVEEAVKRNRKITVMFVDWEAQFKLTIDFVHKCFDTYAEHVDVNWVCLPLRTTNACSQVEPEWTCWEPSKKDLWVREPPACAITDEKHFPFYRHAMTFEEFVPEFGRWFANSSPDGRGAVLIGIRSVESLNRFRTLVNSGKTLWKDWRWTTHLGEGCFNAYPIYDWRTEDVWTYNAKSGKPHNPLYDRMYLAGLSVHQMRICEPYGDEQRKGLWLYHVIEPETWSKICARVAGANSGALYANEKGNVLGNKHVSLPAGHTWKTFALFLLDTMPEKTADHYRNKIAVYLQWYINHEVPELPDAVPGDTGAADKGSWRRICKTLLKQDYWCKGLSFSPTKTDAYGAYQDLMKRRRDKWNIFSEVVTTSKESEND